jgi:hypothetical protein
MNRLSRVALLLFLGAGLLVTQVSCSVDKLLCANDKVQRVFVGADGERHFAAVVVWEGDQVQLTGSAGLDPSAEFCEQDEVMFTVARHPDKWKWATTDSSVAYVTPGGMLHGIKPGKASIRATVDGVTSDAMPVEVGPWLKTIHFTANPPVGKVGQLTTVRVYAITVAGDTVAAPLISPLSWSADGVTDGPWTKGWVTTTENSFTPTVSGETRIATHAYRTGRPGFGAQLQYAVKP